MPEMLKMFETCPNCRVQELIVYDDNTEECTSCGWRASLHKEPIGDSK